MQLVGINPDAPKDLSYPHVVESHGENPSQYGWDDEEEEWADEEWDDEEWSDDEEWDNEEE